MREFAVSFLLTTALLFTSGSIHKNDLNEVQAFRFYLGTPMGRDISSVIDQSQNSINIGMYYIGSPDLPIVGDVISGLVGAKKRGVKLNIGIEKKKWSKESYKYFKRKDIPVRIYKDTKTQHLKVAVFDDEFIYVGSQNFTYSALSGKNWESGMLFKSEKMAKKLDRYIKRQG